MERGSQDSEEQVIGVRRDLEALKFFGENNYYWVMTPENFPNLTPEFVAIIRYFAIDSLIGAVKGMRMNTADQEGKQMLGNVIVKLIGEQEKTALVQSELFPEGEPDEELIASRLTSGQGVDPVRALEMAISLGLVDQIDRKKSPALRDLSEREILFLKLQAVDIRRSKLSELASRFRKTGLATSSEEADPIKAKIDDEVRVVTNDYSEILTQYLGVSS